MVSSKHLTRRNFLLSSASVLGLTAITASVSLSSPSPEIPGNILGAAYKIGHKLRGGSFPEPTETRETNIAIIGGGIAGLSAAWKLQKSGISDFMIFDMDTDVGGNARSGQNAVSAYPWGAHYVPLLTQESKAAHELFEDFGIITGTRNGLPVYNDYYLCSDPHERLYMYGHWHDGFVPEIGVSESDQEQHRNFFAEMERYKFMRGKDGRRGFSIPVDTSSQDPSFKHFDTFSMADYMSQQGWNAPSLIWYVDYCCCDDYGATYDQVSAWAGIHYFASRNGRAANADSQTVITWPEGNGWFVERFKQRLKGHCLADALVYSVKPDGHGVRILYLDVTNNKTVEVKAKAAVMATPRFVAQRLTGATKNNEAFQYSPWVVANITLDALPEGRGAPLSWDNMIYGSSLLGYVVATHQNLNRIQTSTVLTYYWPLSDKLPAQAREEAIGRSYTEWCAIFLKELLAIHPELHGHVRNIDIWLWGHGMIRPTPHFIWGQERREALIPTPPLFYAHSDMSGISIFEEAHYRGVKAAEDLMSYIHHPYETSI